MSAGNSLHLRTIAALALSVVWCHLGDALDLLQIWGVSFCREDSTKEHHRLLFYGTLLAVENKSFFWATLNRLMMLCIVVSVILSDR